MQNQPDNHIDFFAPKILWTIIGVLLLVVIVGSVYWWKEIKKVGVGVCMVGVNSPCNGQNQQAPTLRSGQSDVPSDWKTYTNTEYGFEFKYPGDVFDGVFEAQSSSGVDGFYLIGSKAIETVSILPKGEFNYGYPADNPKVEQITVGGKKAEKSTWKLSEGGTLKSINIKEDLRGWLKLNRIEIRDVNKEAILNQILSTFKFFEPTVILQDDSISINFMQCESTRRTFGSTTFDIIGNSTTFDFFDEQNPLCFMDYGDEVENSSWDGKLPFHCQVPVSLGTLEFPRTNYGVSFSKIASYCKT